MTSVLTATAEGFVHPALFYSGREEYLAGTVPFIRAGLAADEPVAVSVPGPNVALLRRALGADADGVRFMDMTEVGRNPGRIIPGVLRAFADAHSGRRVRIIGEPIWPARSHVEYPACAQHEALINLAFAGRPVTILCPYDATGLAPAVLADARVTHPVLIERGRQAASDRYCPEQIMAAYNRPLPRPPDAVNVEFDRATFTEARRFAAAGARRAGLAETRADDLELAVGELLSNSVLHGGGSGTLGMWTQDGHLVCEVTDRGRLTDPLAGRRPVRPEGERGRGLLLVNLLCDLVRIHTADTTTTIRAYVRLRP
jgi:anti-sigma regulatory factor (Ser/Thr protein kinase)